MVYYRTLDLRDHLLDGSTNTGRLKNIVPQKSNYLVENTYLGGGLMDSCVIEVYNRLV